MGSPASSPRKYHHAPVSSSESIELDVSSDEIGSDTESSDERYHPQIIKPRMFSNAEDLAANGYPWLKFGRALSTNSPLRDLCKEKIKDLVKFLKNSPELPLTKLDIYESDMGDDGAKLLAAIIKNKTSITTVSFTNSKIGDEGTKALAEAIKNNPDCSIKELVFYGNSIGTDGAKALAELLTTKTSITKLDLSNNRVTTEGIKALVDAIKSNNSITSLILNSNSIDDEGAKSLAELIQTSVTVVEIDLAGNKISAKGAKYLAEAIKANPHTKLARLNLSNCSIGEADYKKNNYTNNGFAALADAMEMNNSIIELKVTDNNCDTNSKLDKEIIKQQCGINAIKPAIEDSIAAGLDLLTRDANTNGGTITSVRDVNSEIAKKLYLLDKSDKLINVKIRKNPNIVINKYT